MAQHHRTHRPNAHLSSCLEQPELSRNICVAYLTIRDVLRTEAARSWQLLEPNDRTAMEFMRRIVIHRDGDPGSCALKPWICAWCACAEALEDECSFRRSLQEQKLEVFDAELPRGFKDLDEIVACHTNGPCKLSVVGICAVSAVSTEIKVATEMSLLAFLSDGRFALVVVSLWEDLISRRQVCKPFECFLGSTVRAVIDSARERSGSRVSLMDAGGRLLVACPVTNHDHVVTVFGKLPCLCGFGQGSPHHRVVEQGCLEEVQPVEDRNSRAFWTSSLSGHHRCLATSSSSRSTSVPSCRLTSGR